MSTRTLLRAFQRLRADGPDPGFMADLEMLKHKDLDLSIRLGALLAFDALLINTAINPIAASPGSPISLDASRQPLEVVVIALAIALLAISATLSVRAVMIGEEFETDGIENDPVAIRQRLFAAFARSVDAQLALLRLAVRFTLAGGGVALLTFVWILAEKML